MDSPVALVFLGLIAAATVVQTGLLLGVAIKGMALARRLEHVEDELRPKLQRASDVVDNLGHITDGLLSRLPDVESTIDDTLRKVRRTTGMVETLVVKPLSPLATAVALWKGLRAGTSFYRTGSVRS